MSSTPPISPEINTRQIYTNVIIQQTGDIHQKWLGSEKLHALNINYQHPGITNFKIYDQNIRCNKCAVLLFKDMVEKVNILKFLHDLVRKKGKVDNNNQECT